MKNSKVCVTSTTSTFVMTLGNAISTYDLSVEDGELYSNP